MNTQIQVLTSSSSFTLGNANGDSHYSHSIKTFNHEQFGSIRTMEMPDGQIGFVGKDIAQVLGYSRTADAIRQHVDDEDKGVFKMQTPGGVQSIVLINESGLYSLILSSKLPKAREFKHWVTAVVLPQIRKTGGYINAGDNDDDNTILCKALMIAQRTIEENQRKLEAREALIEEIRPMAEYAEDALLVEDCMTTTQVAKSLGMSAIELNKWLCSHHIQYWQSGQYMLYADYARRGYGKHRTHLYHDEDGEPHTRSYLVWTERGKEFIVRMFNQFVA